MSSQFFVGLDLGQVSDPTALAVLERLPYTAPGPPRPRSAPPPARGAPRWTYQVRHLHRWKLGTKYPAIAADVKELLLREVPDKPRPPLSGCKLIVDQTGVGRPVVDILAGLGLPAKLVPVTITAGGAVTSTAGGLGVPKKFLVGVMQVLLQSGRLRVVESLPHAEALIKELINFRVKITAAANETFEAWRENDHDDLVFAVALAAYYAEREPVCSPPILDLEGRGRSAGPGGVFTRPPGLPRSPMPWMPWIGL